MSHQLHNITCSIFQLSQISLDLFLYQCLLRYSPTVRTDLDNAERPSYVPQTYETPAHLKAALCNSFPHLKDLFSDRIMEKLWEWDKMCDKPDTWDPQWTPLQDCYGNWLQFLGLFTKDWALKLNELLLHGVDL